MSVFTGVTFYIVSFMLFFFFKQKTAYEMRISDWSSDVCSSDLADRQKPGPAGLGCLLNPRRSIPLHAPSWGRGCPLAIPCRCRSRQSEPFHRPADRKSVV